MYTWISPIGETITTKSVKQFSETYGVPYSNAKQLACGSRTRALGWCSTHKKAAKQRERFTTVLVNTLTGEHHIIGRSVKSFAREHGLAFRGLSELVNGNKVAHKGWVLEKTLRLAHGNLAGANI